MWYKSPLNNNIKTPLNLYWSDRILPIHSLTIRYNQIKTVLLKTNHLTNIYMRFQIHAIRQIC